VGVFLRAKDRQFFKGGAGSYEKRGELELVLELELIQTQMAQEPMLRAELYALALRASQNVKRRESTTPLNGVGGRAKRPCRTLLVSRSVAA
jgi:hypothetical protein